MVRFQHILYAARKTKHIVSFTSKNVATHCIGINVASAPSCTLSSLLQNSPALAHTQGVLHEVTPALSISARD